MSEVQMSDDNGIEYDEVDMGETGVVGSNRKEIENFLDALQTSNFNQAEKHIEDLLGGRVQDALDQKKVEVASNIFNKEEEEEDEEVILSDEEEPVED